MPRYSGKKLNNPQAKKIEVISRKNISNLVSKEGPKLFREAQLINHLDSLVKKVVFKGRLPWVEGKFNLTVEVISLYLGLCFPGLSSASF